MAKDKEHQEPDQDDNGAYDPNLDFGAEDVKLPGLVPDGTYHGNITGVVYDKEKFQFTWSVCLVENGGMCTDDETEIDGVVIDYRNWLPKPEDSTTLIKSGKMSKRQSKINMFIEFIERMQLEEARPPAVIEAVENGEYIGVEVDVIVNTETYNSFTSNRIQKMYVPVKPTF